jgi:hypothetical protein
MDLPEYHRHSFVIRISIELGDRDAGQTVWWGEITHWPGGERRAFRDLDEILLFITPYLGTRGSEIGFFGRVLRWLSHRNLWFERRHDDR